MNWLMGLLLMSVAFPTLACKCVVKGDLESVVRHELSTAISVVEARVTGAKVQQIRRDGARVEEQTSSWVVTRVWKGDVTLGSQFLGKSVITCCLCGLEVAQGESYLLFRHSGQYHNLSGCGNDVLMEEAQDQIELIERLLSEYSEK